MSNSQPHITQSKDRIAILDTLRGFAVFGILMVNITAFALPKHDFSLFDFEPILWYHMLAVWINTHFFEGKFYILFSFLFGIGFSIQLKSIIKKGGDLWLFYPRRLLVLFVIGVLHSYFWWGDVLRLYAVLGFGLLLCKDLSVKSLLMLSSVFLLLSGILPMIEFYDNIKNPTADDVFYSFLFILAYMGPTAFALFLLGQVVGKLEFFNHLNDKANLLKKIIAIAFFIWSLLKIMMYFLIDSYSIYETLPATLRDMAFTSIYISILCLLSINQKTKKYLMPITNVGRMALTNYVMHTVICVSFFRLLNLEGEIGGAYVSLIALLVFVLQMTCSTWWFNRFNYGLLEWLWRSLTFGKWQKL